MKRQPSLDYAKERVDTVTYFSRCGESFTALLPMSYRQVEDWATARQCYEEATWESTRLEARNTISGHLSRLHREDYHKWNELVREFKAHLNANAFPFVEAFAVQQSLGPVFVPCAQWYLLNYGMEEAYQAYDLPFSFYRELFRVYKSGHFPCGWEGGEWPKGRSMIY